jgi:tetratricopeptide (TPR) repeat protein
MLNQIMAKAFLVIFIFLSVSVENSARSDSNSILQEGLNAYQAGQYDKARSAFTELKNDRRWSFASLYNLGNVAARQKRYGEALALYRLALEKKPMDPDTRANIAFVLNTLGIREFPGARGSWELYRVEILNSLTIDQILAAFFITFFFFLFNLFKFLKKRKLAAYSEEPLFVRPPVIFYLWLALLIFVSTTSIAKIADGYIERATVVASAKTDLRSGPGESNASLAELNEGFEVQVQDESDGWRQVVALNGARAGLTGWVKSDALMSTSGGGPW